ncbi:MAG: hypothetical protein Ct9H300mP14_06550 [Gammaproteobacteria bacterium]|nr:MAG: hypothetical protein Ct9H300mP14_06550 [Gammaproteobacteria bacterium]
MRCRGNNQISRVVYVDEGEREKAWLSELGLVVPGGMVRSIEESVEAAGEIGFPVCVKACDGLKGIKAIS